jgi:phosphodiesterase/alkaline phosphatase D-like protein
VWFAFSGDADAQPPRYNAFDVYARMAAEGNAFSINLGDTIYSDSEHPGVPPALTVALEWAKYRLNLSLPALQSVRSATGLYSHWDDHEFSNDFTPEENGSAVYTAGAPPSACLTRINDASRTMLGARQYQAFTAAIARSTAAFKVIVNEVSIQQFYALPTIAGRATPLCDRDSFISCTTTSRTSCSSRPAHTRTSSTTSATRTSPSPARP